MKEISIKNLAYYLRQASDRGLPSPIFFLGAGASFSGKIPLASGIETIIKDKYRDNPDILTLAETDKTYSKLMGCLSPVQRNELLDGLIKAAKINVTHIYLAQLIEKNLVDYVLTANFDNLMLRALALFDIFPPVYDLTSISDFTTTTIKDKSVVYLHGQHNGTWLLNTDEEMTKVKTIVPRIFDTIKNKRPWIFLGYSGSDPIFEHIKNLGRFDNGLYWVGHDDYLPSKEVQSFLNKPNTNAHFIKGYDADAFMLKLNHELGLEQPDILDKPFSSLKTMLANIVDIDDEDHFRGAKVRLEIARKNIDYSIHFFEDMGDIKLNKNEQNIDKLKKDIIDLIIAEQYDETEISEISLRAKKYNDQGINDLLAELFFYVGNKYTLLLQKCDVGNRENLLNKTIENYNESITYMPDSSQSHYNYGVSLSALAAFKTGTEAETLYEQAIEKYSQAFKLDPSRDGALNNLGINLTDLAAFKTGTEAENLYHQAFETYRRAIEINPHKKNVFNNWGISLSTFAALRTGAEAQDLYEQAIEKYTQAIKINPTDDSLLNNCGVSLSRLAAFKTGTEAETLYEQAIEKCRQALEINPENHIATYSLGSSLLKLASIMTGEIADKLYTESFEKFQQAVDANADFVNVFSEWAIGLSKQAASKNEIEAEGLYRKAFEKYYQALETDPNDVNILYNWALSLSKLAALITGTEAVTLYEQAIDKYIQAIKINPTDDNILNNYGSALVDLAGFKTEKEAETLYELAIEKCRQALEAKPDKYEAIYNWGSSLLALARLKTGTEAETLYEQAIDKYRQAQKIKPATYQLLQNWGNALMMLAKSKTGKEAKKLYQEACKKLENAYEHKGICYNLACSYAHLKRTEEALKYLTISLENNEVTVKNVLADEDWKEYLADNSFTTIIKEHTN